jgi:hypothetical protein
MFKAKLHKMKESLATEWIEALRSGNYTKGAGFLVHKEFDNKGKEESCSYCCLGVLGKLHGLDSDQMDQMEILNTYRQNYNKHEHNYQGIPEQFWADDTGPDTAIGILVSMNDNLTYSSDANNNRMLDKYIFRKKLKVGINEFTFEEIADFMEDNFEFI